MKIPWKIKALGLGLVVLFSLVTAGVVSTFFTNLVTLYGFASILLEAVICLCFVVGGLGLLRLDKRSRRLTIGLCAIRIIQFAIWFSWAVYIKVTTGSTMDLGQLFNYFGALFYLAIALFLMSNSVKRIFV